MSDSEKRSRLLTDKATYTAIVAALSTTIIELAKTENKSWEYESAEGRQKVSRHDVPRLAAELDTARIQLQHICDQLDGMGITRSRLSRHINSGGYK